MSKLYVKNWRKFQHYKDRNPPWIKLHKSMLQNYDLFHLSNEAFRALIMTWLVVTETDGEIPDVSDVAFTIRMDVDRLSELFDELVEAGFLSEVVPVENKQYKEESELFTSRYIPKETKEEVLKRDGGKCKWCGSESNIEIDHITPCSMGGSSEIDNLQLLCRSCNRKKRSNPSLHLSFASDCYDKKNLRTQRQRQRQRRDRDIVVRKDSHADAFETFWDAYPKKKGKLAAKKAFDKAVKSVHIDSMLSAIERQKQSRDWLKDGGQYIPLPASWLNQGRWDDETDVVSQNEEIKYDLV